MTTITDVSYRLAIVSDCEQLAELRIRQLRDEGYAETKNIRPELTDYFIDSLQNGTLVCWLATKKETVCATAAVCFYRLPPTFSNPGGQVAYITNIYTADAFRRNGLASELLQKLILEVRNRGYPSVRLHASEDGWRIYERAGFTRLDGFMSLQL